MHGFGPNGLLPDESRAAARFVLLRHRCSRHSGHWSQSMAKKPELDDFRVPYFDGKKIAKFALADFDPGVKPFSTGTKDSDRERLATIGAQLDALQERLHAQSV